MVAVIKTGHSLHRILNYNENKVKEAKRSVFQSQITRWMLKNYSSITS